MVKIGFIVEGATEKKILESPAFRQYLTSLNLSYIPEVIDAKGNGKLLPEYLPGHIQMLKDKGANKIIILTDLDADVCITATKGRIGAPADCIVIVSVKMIESWFIADTITMRHLLGDPGYTCVNPETIVDPYEEIRQTMLRRTGRGMGGKSKLFMAARFIKSGFTAVKASNHPNCTSAKYFVSKLESLSAN